MTRSHLFRTRSGTRTVSIQAVRSAVKIIKTKADDKAEIDDETIQDSAQRNTTIKRQKCIQLNCPDSTHVPNGSTRVPKSRYPSNYLDFSPDKHSLARCIEYISVIMIHGLASRDRNASDCAFIPQPSTSVPEPLNCDHIWSDRSGTTGRSGMDVNTGARLRSGPEAVM